MIGRNFACTILIILVIALFPVAGIAQKRPKEVATEAPTHEVTTGKLMLYSCPAGAIIYLNNRKQGEYLPDTKLSRPLELKAGTYSVRVEHADYNTITKTIKIEAGKQFALDIQPDLKQAAKYGNLSLKFTQFNDKTLVQIDNEKIDHEKLILQKEGLISLKLLIGDHDLKVTVPGFKPFITKVPINGAENTQVPIILENLPAIVKINAEPGTRVYLNNQEQGVVPNTGTLSITASLVGNVPLLLEHNSYENYQDSIELRSDEEKVLNIKQRLKVSSTEFADNFEGDLNLWNAPADWPMPKGFLHVRGTKTIGMPKKRYYCNSEIVFGLRLLDPRGAAWAVHAIDDKNYYLFYLNGPKGKAPNKFQVFLCRDGVIDFNTPLQAPLPIIPNLEVGQSYRISIIIKGNTIEHQINDSNTGEDRSIGFFVDAGNNYACGNFGFVTVDNEDFQIHGLLIKPLP